MSDDINTSTIGEIIGGFLFLVFGIAVAYYVGKWAASSDCMDRAYTKGVQKEQASAICKGE
jgi:hypothetical protein